ncbi:hypothetical protein FMM75_11395 [Lachnospiraceae bacterium MD335]|nr:hypothetical protein [Lachnospiraceae bacterium MD335]
MRKTARINIIMVVMAFMFIMAFSIVGKASGNFRSQGKIVFTNKTASTRDDVVFDAGDFERLAQICR